MSVLYPSYPPNPEIEAQQICRPPPLGGCIRFIKYDRYISNWLPEFGPFQRFIDRAKLVGDIDGDDIWGDQRFGLVIKQPVMGVYEPPPLPFSDIPYPDAGMICSTGEATA